MDPQYGSGKKLICCSSLLIGFHLRLRIKWGSSTKDFISCLLRVNMLDNILVKIAFSCPVFRPQYFVTKNGRLFYQMAWCALSSNREAHHSLRFNTASSYWSSMLGTQLMVPYFINIRKIVHNWANSQAKRLLAGHTMIKESVCQHTPTTALQSDELFIILHSNQFFSAKTLPYWSWQQTISIWEHDWLAHRGKIDKSQKRNRRATNKRAATKYVLNADDSLRAATTDTKEAAYNKVILTVTPMKMDGTLTSVRDIAPIQR